MSIPVKKLVRAAIIACLYTVICILAASFSFGPVQVRISEAFTMLAVFSYDAIIGVTVGCFLSNMLASAPIDMLVGTLATLISAILTYRLRKFRVKGLALIPSIPPVLINAIVIGIELTFLYFPPEAAKSVWLMNILTVGAGQLISCSIIGVLLVYILERNPSALRLMSD